MLFYDAAMPAPHPRRVRMFLAEKGLNIPRREIAMMTREHKGAAFMARNSVGQVPILELDDGQVIAESVAICRYLDALHPEPPLFGRAPLEAAHVDMWSRRIEFQLMPPLAAVWVHTHPLTEVYAREQGITRFPAFGEENRTRYDAKLRWLNAEIGDSAWLAGNDFSMADIVAISVIEFGAFVGLEVPEDAANVTRWRRAVLARPSAAA